mgnify:CR=1 FL=1
MEPLPNPLLRLGRWLRRRGPRLALELVLLLALVWGMEAFLTRDAAHGPAPPLAGTTVSGAELDLRALRGEPALVYFWASWCPVCRAQQGAVAAVAADHPVVTVAMRSGGPEAVRAHLAEQGLALPTLADPEGRLAARYGVAGVPMAFVLGPEGKVRFVTRGYTTGWGLRLRLWLAGL